MASPESRRPRDLQLVAYVVMGVSIGVAYVVFDVLSESRLASGTLTGPLASAHALIDHALPIVVGGLLGVSVHYLRIRAALAAARDTEHRAEALKDRLHKVERDQAVWVLAAAVLHELNNPLHALGLLLDELAVAPDVGGDPGQSQDLTLRARAQVDRALAQLELLRSMRGAGEPELARVPLDAVVRALAADVGALAGQDGFVVKVESEGAIVARADESYVRTILENLVDNSLQSLRGQAHGTILIRLTTETPPGRALVTVHDDGPALAESVATSLFEPLRSTKTLGLGLGLPIARALARAMRGDVTLGDAATKSFRLELPLADMPAPAAAGGAA